MEQQLKQLLANADSALDAGELAEAENLYQQVLQITNDSVSAHYGIGTIALQQNSVAKAVKHLNQAAQLEPEAADIAFNLATALFLGENRLGALMQLERAAKFCGNDPLFCARIAEMSIRMGEPAAAITIMSRLATLTPDHQLIVANAHGLLGNWRESVSVLKVLASALPNNSMVTQKLALAAGQLRDYDTAISAFESYLKLVTPTGMDYLRFADLLLLAQDTKRCEHALKLAFEHGEVSPELYVLKAKTARLKGDYVAAKAAIELALKQQPNHGQAWAVRAELATGEEVPELVNVLQTQIDQIQDSSKLSLHQQSLLNYALGDMHDSVSNFPQAAQAYRTANSIQHGALVASNTNYNSDSTEKQFEQLIALYPLSLFTEADLRLDPGESNHGESKISPIFIVGMARSGTTLVERILGQNLRVYSAGEQEAMEFVASHYHQQIRNGRVPNPNDASDEQWLELRNMYLAKLPDIDKSIFTDKLPHNFRQVGLILKLFPEAKIIQMHRSKPDVCLSIFSKAFAAGHNYATQLNDLGHYYDQAEELMRHWSSLNSSQVLDLQYEDLVQQPAQYAKQLVEFCGFKWSDEYLDFHKSVNQSFTFSEIQVRQPIQSKRVQRWLDYKDHLPELESFG